LIKVHAREKQISLVRKGIDQEKGKVLRNTEKPFARSKIKSKILKTFSRSRQMGIKSKK